METISFYSYKGGVGRSLVVANFAKYLAMFGQKVFVIDLDLEAPGLHYKFLKFDQGKSFQNGYEKIAQDINGGVVDYIHSVIVDNRLPESLRSYVIDIDIDFGVNKNKIHLMPAGKDFASSYWKSLNKIDWHKLFHSEEEQDEEQELIGIDLFLYLKKLIIKEYNPDFLLIDSRTGVTDIGAVATALLPDKVVCLFIRNLENLIGVRQVLWGIRRTPRIDSPKPIEVLPVLTRIPYTESESFESKEILDPIIDFFNETPIGGSISLGINELPVLHSEPELEIYESLRIGGTKYADESMLLRDYLRLFPKIISVKIIEPYLEPLLQKIAATKIKSISKSSNGVIHEALVQHFSERHKKSEIIMDVASPYREVPNDIKRLFSHHLVDIYDIKDISEWEQNYPNLELFWVLLPRFLGAENPKFEEVMLNNIVNKNTKYIYFLYNEEDIKKLKNLAERLQKRIPRDIKYDIKVVKVEDAFLKQILHFTNYWVANPFKSPDVENLHWGFEVLFKNNIPSGGIPLKKELVETLVELIKSLVKPELLDGEPVLK